jgi:hypothetical protein
MSRLPRQLGILNTHNPIGLHGPLRGELLGVFASVSRAARHLLTGTDCGTSKAKKTKGLGQKSKSPSAEDGGPVSKRQ